jgi:hypothetical protein
LPAGFLEKGKGNKMGKIGVSFEMEIYDSTDEEIREWLRYKLGNSPSISLDNPLCEKEIQAMPVAWRRL